MYLSSSYRSGLQLSNEKKNVTLLSNIFVFIFIVGKGDIPVVIINTGPVWRTGCSQD
jgi:hypothetical protein